MQVKAEDSASHCEYYHAPVLHPSNPGQDEPYVANCEDVIQALGLTFDEGCEFKSIWRRGRGRQGFVKAESTPLRDAQKAVHYAGRVLALEQRKAAPVATLYDWHAVPARFQWMATNADGYVFAYVEKPEIGAPPYWGSSPGSLRMQGISAAKADWRESLERRP